MRPTRALELPPGDSYTRGHPHLPVTSRPHPMLPASVGKPQSAEVTRGSQPVHKQILNQRLLGALWSPVPLHTRDPSGQLTRSPSKAHSDGWLGVAVNPCVSICVAYLRIFTCLYSLVLSTVSLWVCLVNSLAKSVPFWRGCFGKKFPAQAAAITATDLDYLALK